MPFLSTRRRRVRTVLSAAVVLATLVACSATVDGTASRAVGATGTGAATTGAATGRVRHHAAQFDRHRPAEVATQTSTGKPTAAVPAGLEKFYGQQLSWGPCADYSTDDSTKELYAKSTFQCAYLTVPLDYSKPTGSTIKLGVLKVSASTADRIGSVVINPGGPGGSGMSVGGRHRRVGEGLAATVRPGRVRPARSRLRRCRPIRCQTDAERDADRAMVRSHPHGDRGRRGGRQIRAAGEAVHRALQQRTTSTARRSSARSAPSTWPRISTCCGPCSATAS